MAVVLKIKKFQNKISINCFGFETQFLSNENTEEIIYPVAIRKKERYTPPPHRPIIRTKV